MKRWSKFLVTLIVLAAVVLFVSDTAQAGGRHLGLFGAAYNVSYAPTAVCCPATTAFYAAPTTTCMTVCSPVVATATTTCYTPAACTTFYTPACPTTVCPTCPTTAGYGW